MMLFSAFADPASQRPDSDLPSLTGKRALIAEDEGVTQHQIQRTLRRAGIVIVATVSNGAEAVEKTLKEKPELVLMDIQMTPMDGLEAARRILASFPTCILMLTAFPEFEAQALALGCCGYLVKPINAALLLPQLQQALQRFYQH